MRSRGCCGCTLLWGRNRHCLRLALHQRLVKAEAKTIHRLAHLDQLTGIANRRQLYSEIQKETEQAARYERPLSMIYFDLNHFKRVNDTYGHDSGDVFLREVVRVIEPLLRKTDRLRRWGREEFMILAPESNLAQGGPLVERFRVSIASHHYDFALGVTASLGLAQYKAGETPEALITRADEALYKAKALGHIRVESIL
ncbi:MAG TPA: GGDEF domain-containing protein [Rubrobacteraceae bacterium]|nr:GGDEF domain-containing protein [Rubrobacteraceae bacterium]